MHEVRASEEYGSERFQFFDKYLISKKNTLLSFCNCFIQEGLKTTSLFFVCEFPYLLPHETVENCMSLDILICFADDSSLFWHFLWKLCRNPFNKRSQGYSVSVHSKSLFPSFFLTMFNCISLSISRELLLIVLPNII